MRANENGHGYGRRCCHRRIRVQFAVTIVLGAAFVGAKAGRLVSLQPDSPGAAAAAAINELLAGQNGDEAFRNMMRDRTDAVRTGRMMVQDSYPAWLAAKLIRQAAGTPVCRWRRQNLASSHYLGDRR